MGRGRRTSGPELVDGLEGSSEAKRRLKVMLETMAGKRSIAQACQELGMGEAAFHKFRQRTLQDAVGSLEPRAVGRPPRKISSEESEELEVLRLEVKSLRRELRAAELREEIALTMPQLLKRGRGGEKK